MRRQAEREGSGHAPSACRAGLLAELPDTTRGEPWPLSVDENISHIDSSTRWCREILYVDQATNRGRRLEGAAGAGALHWSLGPHLLRCTAWIRAAA